MKLLVTGGAGFIGSNFIRYWRKIHPTDFLVNLDKLTYAGNLENLKDRKGDPHYQMIQGDICDGKVVREAMQGVDIVVHFAAESHVDRSITNPSLFVTTNVSGTQVLLESALGSKVKRFHHISTDEVYGSLDLSTQSKFKEDTPVSPRSPYAATKAASDHLVRSYYYTYNLPITITNCSNNYGPYQYPEKLIPLAITNIFQGIKVPVYGDGKNIRDWLYVEDHCRAIDAVLSGGKIGETYCVGGLTADIDNLTVVKKIIKILGKDESWIKYIKDRPGHDIRYALDWSKIKNELGWKPLFDFDMWLLKTIEWYRSNEAWWKRLKDKDFEKYYQEQYPDL